MQTLNRYVAGLFARNLAIILAVLVSLYGLIDFVEKIDDFIENRAALLHYFHYPLYKLPTMLDQSLPMGVLLAAFITVGQLSGTSQITALRSCGIGLWQATRPLFVCAALLCLVTLAGSAWLAPWSARESRYILVTEIKGNTPTTRLAGNLYFRDNQRIIGAAQSFPERGELRGLNLLELNENFHMTRRVEAATARYQDGTRWLLTDVVEHTFKPDTQTISGFTKQREIVMDLGRRPDEMVDIWYKPEEMTLIELRQLADRLEAQGGDYLRYRAEWQQRLARAITPLLMVLIGVPFALHRGRKASVGLGIGVSLVTFFGYFACQAVGMALGAAELLPLALATWSANMLLLLIGTWLFLTLDN
jgi:lipopolysaccharide export system permease protein